jgi:hypothetical protein
MMKPEDIQAGKCYLFKGGLIRRVYFIREGRKHEICWDFLDDSEDDGCYTCTRNDFAEHAICELVPANEQDGGEQPV